MFARFREFFVCERCARERECLFNLKKKKKTKWNYIRSLRKVFSFSFSSSSFSRSRRKFSSTRNLTSEYECVSLPFLMFSKCCVELVIMKLILVFFCFEKKNSDEVQTLYCCLISSINLSSIFTVKMKMQQKTMNFLLSISFIFYFVCVSLFLCCLSQGPVVFASVSAIKLTR